MASPASSSKITMWATVFSNFFSLECLIALVVGVVGGMVIGALPGLNATMAISLLIPITYTMSPYAAFTMMMAVEVPAGADFTQLANKLTNLGHTLGVEINLRNEQLYRAMHQLEG